MPPTHTSRVRLSHAVAVALTLLAPAASEAAAQAQLSDSARLANFLVITRKPLQHPLRTAAVKRSTMPIGTYADGSPMLVELTRPATSSRNPLPVVLLVHGGLSDDAPVRPRAWQVYKDWGTVLAASGVAAVMFDHGLGGPQRRLDRSLSEIDIVLRWLKSDGARLGLAVDSIHVAGFSAAGLLASELLRKDRPMPVSRMLLVYPLTGIAPEAAVSSGADDATAARMNLGANAAFVAKRGAKLLVIRAGADAIVGLLPLLDRNVAALIAADARLELVNVPGEPHGFDAEHDTPDVRAAIDRSLRFIAGARGEKP